MKSVARGIIGLLLMLLLIILSSSNVHADVIWEPNDSFYQKHSSDCIPMNRFFTANGSIGNVTLWESPNSQKEVATYENGVSFLIRYTYTDDNSVNWGIYDDFSTIGWLRMDDLTLVYDNISFCEEHQSEFKEYNGELDGYEADAPIIFWSFPGSGVINSQIPRLTEDIRFQYIYTDEDKRKWVYTPYKDYQWIGSWLCMSDPTNENLPVTDTTGPTSIPADSVQSLPESENQSSTFIILAIAVVALVAITSLLIHVFWKKDKAKHNQ